MVSYHLRLPQVTAQTPFPGNYIYFSTWPRTMFRPVVSTPKTVSRLITFGMPSHKSEEARSLLDVEELVEQVSLCALPRWGAEHSYFIQPSGTSNLSTPN
jgi:hypothetical protein